MISTAKLVLFLAFCVVAAKGYLDNRLPFQPPQTPRKWEGEYSAGPGGFLLPPSAKSDDFAVQEIEYLDEEENKLKTQKVLTVGAQLEVEAPRPPSFLSRVRSVLSSPLVILMSFVPLMTMLAALYLPDLLSGLVSKPPTVTTTVASRFARHLAEDGEGWLDTLNEVLSRGMDDPRCFKKIACEAARSQIESSNRWSSALKHLSRAVDQRVWDSLGMSVLLSALQRGDCAPLHCSGAPAYTSDVPVADKVRLLGSKLMGLTLKDRTAGM